MTKNPTVRFFCQLAISGAVVVSAVGSVDAQLSGGDFGAPPNAKQSSSLTDSQATKPALQKSQSTFNAVPFRTKHDLLNTIHTEPRTNDSVRPPLQLSSPSPKAQTPELPRPVVAKNHGSNSRSAKPVRPKQEPSNLASPGKPISGAVSAQPASFGIPAPRQSTSEESKSNQGASQMAKFVDLSNCTVSFIDDIKLPAKESGVIQSLDVKEGEFIPAGKVVGKIDDELYRRMFEQAELRFNMAKEMATDTTAIQAAEKKYRVAGIEAAKTRRLGQTGSKSKSEVLMADYTQDIALIELKKAQLEKDKAYSEARLEAARLSEVQTHIKRHVLESDFDAYVIEVFKKPQEFVQIGEEVMRIARMDKLWVQGIVNIAVLNPNEVINRPVTVTVDLARGETATFEGKIVYVALERQSLQSYMVKAEITNRAVGDHWMLQPLSSVKMRIHLDGEAPGDSFGSAAKPSVKR